MASVTNFIRNTTPAWLRDYFTKTGIVLPTPVDWDASEPEVVKPLLQAVDEMDDEARGRIINDGERVSAMADDAGQTALYSVIDDRAVLDELENGHAGRCGFSSTTVTGSGRPRRFASPMSAVAGGAGMDSSATRT